jgi:hypothetical protein
MTPQLQTYYEKRIAMMSDDAWKDLMEDVQTMLSATNVLDGVTADNMRYKQGEVSIMRWMLSLKEVSEQAYQQLKDDDATTP